MSEIETDLEQVDEGAGSSMSGSAWMFHYHYNPELLQALQQVLVGENLDEVITSLLEQRLSVE